MANSTFVIDDMVGASQTFRMVDDGSGSDWLVFNPKVFSGTTAITLQYETAGGVVLSASGAYDASKAAGNQQGRLIVDGVIENVRGSNGADAIVGNKLGNMLYGDHARTGAGGKDTISAGSGNDTVYGGAGGDTLRGDAGNDRLDGGAGLDRLYGGSGADRFVFVARTESTVASAGRDIIYDFSHSQGDRIDLSAIDASSKSGGNQTFAFIGSAAFSGVAGQLRAVTAASDTYVYADTNGDRTADFAIRLDDPLTLVKGDFIL